MQNKIEVIVISIIAFLCILISVLDFADALESIPWISQRISIMTLLAIGMIAIYLVTQMKDGCRSFRPGNFPVFSPWQ